MTPKKSRKPIVLALALLLTLGVVGAAWFVKRGPDFPDEWDSRVLPFVEIVEEERDLEFEHPVHVDFLTEGEFEEQVTADEGKLTKKERKELKQAVGFMRALGVISGDIDLLKTMNELHGSSVIGLYSFEDKRIRLRGTKLTPAVKATLVHELTHVLQDQHFDLSAKQDQLDESEDSGASAAWEALVEGDANRVEEAYKEDLTSGQQKALEEAQQEFSEKTADRASKVPQFFQTYLGSSYAFGEAMLALSTEVDGRRAVDRLFRKPPTTEEQLLDPWTLVGERQEALDVATPKARKGEEEFDSGTFGSPGWLFVLAERVPLQDALAATDGWGGDAYLGFERDGRSCVRVNFRGDTRKDLDEMHTQLRRWIIAGPKGVSRVSVTGQTLSFESCDPGNKAPGGRDASEDALQLAVGRTWIALSLIQSGAPSKVAECGAKALAAELEPKRLFADDFGSRPGETKAAQALVRECAG